MTWHRHSDWYDEDPEPTPPPTVTYIGGWTPGPGEKYEWGVAGSDEVWGNYLDPVRCPVEETFADDADWLAERGVTEVWVRPCSWMAGHNAGGIAATPRDYHRPWHEKPVTR